MSRTARALHRFCLGRPCRVITSVDDEPYMIRVYVAHWRGHRRYLHRFLTADGERWLHDHPFDGFSLVLSGGYDEDLMPAFGQGVRTRRVRWANWVPGNKFHRIARVRPNTWTLFVHGPHRKLWGFVQPIESGNHYGLLYHNPFDQSDSGGAHWWEKPDCLVYPPPGVGCTP